MCDQDWLAEYEALRDRPFALGQLVIEEFGARVYVAMSDGDHMAEFSSSFGSEPPQDARRNALLFVKAWEAAHD